MERFDRPLDLEDDDVVTAGFSFGVAVVVADDNIATSDFFPRLEGGLDGGGGGDRFLGVVVFDIDDAVANVTVAA